MVVEGDINRVGVEEIGLDIVDKCALGNLRKAPTSICAPSAPPSSETWINPSSVPA